MAEQLFDNHDSQEKINMEFRNLYERMASLPTIGTRALRSTDKIREGEFWINETTGDIYVRLPANRGIRTWTTTAT